MLETGPLKCSHIYHRRNSLGSVEGNDEALKDEFYHIFPSIHSWGQHSTVNSFIQFSISVFSRNLRWETQTHTHIRMKSNHVKVLSEGPLKGNFGWNFLKIIIVSKTNICQQICATFQGSKYI